MVKRNYLFCFILFSVFSFAFSLVDTRQVEITNGLVRAKLSLPNKETGYYQATRFDWSGIINSLNYKGHSYFEEWFGTYDPKKNDAITGPVEEFTQIGYESAPVGGEFLKIGVGMLRKADEKPYSIFSLYDIANAGTWKVKPGKDKVEFTHELKDASGYSYIYRKTVKLVKGKPELVLEHSLKNTGQKLIETTVYNHNFFVIDKEPTGPAIKIKFPFDIVGKGQGIGTVAEINGSELNYLRELKRNENVYLGDITGYGATEKDYNFQIENLKTGAGVKIKGDKPLAKMIFWSSSTTSCPEPYINVKAQAGQEFKWVNSYEFYVKDKK
ncbi:hypothetical protein [Adhaeribacter aquaticus]|uniref:hypothetical protein n=1 Tax=Adhaeribacter aquaticus TaxID=299567 RepID=UPI000426DAA4|nr:hypothetical protein [Adhaeribacter aquaticus]